MQKVFHIITGLGRGGAEKILLNYTKTFKQFNHIIIYLSSEDPLKNSFDKSNCQIISIRNIFKIYSINYLIKKIFNSERICLIGWMYHGGLLAALINIFKKNTNTSIYLHHSSIFKGNLKIQTILIALTLGILTSFSKCKLIWCSSRGLKNHNFIYRSKVKKYIPNGFKIEKNKNLIHKNFQNKNFSILMITRWDKVKNNELAMKIFSKVNQIKPNTELFLVGNEMTNKNIELLKLRNIYSNNNNIKLLGYIKNLDKLIEKCDLLLLTSKSESFPMAIGEAMNNGVTCVATDVGDIKKIIGDTGYTFKIEEHKKAVEYILLLINEKLYKKTKWIERSEACRKRIANKFDNKKIFNLLHESFIAEYKN